jgi:hypothetical protein
MASGPESECPLAAGAGRSARDLQQVLASEGCGLDGLVREGGQARGNVRAVMHDSRDLLTGPRLPRTA